MAVNCNGLCAVAVVWLVVGGEILLIAGTTRAGGTGTTWVEVGICSAILATENGGFFFGKEQRLVILVRGAISGVQPGLPGRLL